jgi:hypothetical protein
MPQGTRAPVRASGIWAHLWGRRLERWGRQYVAGGEQSRRRRVGNHWESKPPKGRPERGQNWWATHSIPRPSQSMTSTSGLRPPRGARPIPKGAGSAPPALARNASLVRSSLLTISPRGSASLMKWCDAPASGTMS